MTGNGDATEERFLGGYTGRLFLILMAGSFSILLGKRLLPPLLPVIIENLAITSFEAGIALTMLAICRAIVQYPGGRAADQLTHKTVLITSVGLAIVGFGLLAASFRYVFFLLGIAILGVGSGLFDPVSRVVLWDLFDNKRGRALGFNAAAGDIAGIVAAAGAVGVVMVAPWQTAFVPPVLVLAVVLLAMARWNRGTVEFRRVKLGLPKTASRLFGTGKFRWLIAAYSIRMFSSRSVNDFLPAFLIATQGYSLEFASGAFALQYVVGLGARWFAGALSDISHPPIIVVITLIVSGAGLGVLLVATSPLVVVGAIVLYSVGQKAFRPPMEAYLLESLPDSNLGGDLGATRSVYLGIGSLSPTFIGYLATVANFRVAYATLLVCLLISAGIVAFLALK